MMSSFDPDAYGPLFSRLLQVDRDRDLGAGRPDSAIAEQLSAFDVDAAFDGQRIADRRLARLCLSGLWLLHDFLDESHTISQSVETIDGSYWHGIMHRCEGDFSNAKYWFRNAGRHDAFDAMPESIKETNSSLKMTDELTKLSAGDDWHPDAFVDLCQQAAGRETSLQRACQHVAVLEWQMLFDWCYRRAVGSA